MMNNNLIKSVVNLQWTYGFVGPLLMVAGFLFLFFAPEPTTMLNLMCGIVFGLGLELLITATNCYAMLNNPEDDEASKE